MERNRAAVRLALFALPDPPSCSLVERPLVSSTEGKNGAVAGAAAEGPSGGRSGCAEADPSLNRRNRLADDMGAGRGEGGVAEGAARRGRDGAEAEVEAGAYLGRPGSDAVRAGKGRAGPRSVLESPRKEKGEGTTAVDVLLAEPCSRSREGPQCGGRFLHEANSSPHLTHHWKHDVGDAREPPKQPPSRGDTPVSSSCAPSVTDLARVEAEPCASTETRMPDFTVPYDPSFEIILCCGKVLSPWRRIWESSPLVFHDKNFVRCLGPWNELYDITALISAILEAHPGPVLYFRIDSSQWTGGQTQLSKWLKTLSEKLASELVIINRVGKSDLELPLQDIQSTCLKRLRVGFFALSDLDIGCFQYGVLDTLQLIGCTFDTMRLYGVIENCSNLTHLEIGLSVKDIKLNSRSLKYLQIWRCSMRHLLIEFAPSLSKVVLGARPKEKSMLLTVKEAPLLLQFEYLLLPFHTVKEKDWIKTLKILRLGLQMANSSQRTFLSEVLMCAHSLQDLILWRMDDIDITEELDVVVDDSLSACPPSLALQTFIIEDFRAGGAEIALAGVILKYAAQLKYLRLFAYAGSSQELIKKVVRELRRKERMSRNCLIIQMDPEGSGANS